MKIDIVGASNFVNRMFEACGTFQWAREFLKNSQEAGATKVSFGIEWQAVDKLGVYRRTIIDNGEGMSREELLNFFSKLGEGGKKIGGVHDNFGVGAKIASLPWNPDGVVVITYQGGRPSMIWIVLNQDTSEYELMEFQLDEGASCAIDPSSIDWSISDDGIDWSALKPDWLQDQGTIIVLLGDKNAPDSILGNPGANEADTKGLSAYLNTRFWDLNGIEVVVTEVRSSKKNKWPMGVDDRDDSRRPNNRRIRGARYYLTDIEAKGDKGKHAATGSLFLDNDRVLSEWYLWEGERPVIHMYAKKQGYIAVRYNNELFEVTTTKPHFRWFGIIESAVQQNLTIILEPPHYSKDGSLWGIHPDQSRNRLIFTGDGQKGESMPLSDWGLDFTEQLPEEVLEAIRKARKDTSASMDDENYRKRLQDKFGSRWTVKARVQKVSPSSDPKKEELGKLSETDIEILERIKGVKRQTRKKRNSKTVRVLQKKMTSNGELPFEERDVPVDVPRITFGEADDFDKPWHLALWAPNDPEGPSVMINAGSPILDEVIKFHQDKYPPVHAEEVAKTIMQVFGEVAACKVAHSQKLTKNIPIELLDSEYRSEPALTIALMGLMAEESLIAQRLGKLGRSKKSVA